MKKALFTLLLFCLIAFASACGGGGGGSSSQGSTIIPIAIDAETSKTITLSKTAFCINKGKTENITVYYDGKDVTNEAKITFVSENVEKSTVATVENGVITALKAGTAIFKVSYQEASDVNFTVTVIDPTIPNLEVSQTEITIELGDSEKETENVTVTLDGKDVTNEVIFTSSDESVATVDKGTITFVGEGTANIIVHLTGANDQLIKVTVTLSNLQLSEEETTLTIGESYDITATINDKDVTSKAIFNTKNSKIATVDENGKINAISEGTTTIIVSVKGAKNAKFKVNVYDPALHTIVTDFEELELYIGKSQNINVTVNGKDKTKSTNTTYESSDSNIATVDENGLITAISEGTAVITVHVENTESDKLITVTVNKYDLTLSQSNVELGFLDNISNEDLTITNNDEDDVTSKATYESSDPDIVTIDENGKLISGTITGTATITVHVDGANDTTFTVEVNDDSTEIPLDNNALNQLYEIGKIKYTSGNKTSLTQIDIPIYYRHNDTCYKITSLAENIFYNCSNLKTVTIPETVTEIGKQAFYNCSSLSTIVIPEGVTSIEEGTFRDCSSLNEVIIPETVTEIGKQAFYNCSSLPELTIPSGITNIPIDTFNGCSSLEITLPDNITSVGNNAFSRVKNLTYNCNNYDGPWGAYGVTITDDVTSIKESAFNNCSSLRNVNIPNTVTEIGSNCFKNCTSLISVTMPNGIEAIQESTFEGCSSLANITIPNSITNFGIKSFKNCSSLHEITIPDGITTIQESTFEGCSSLSNITIPEGVTEIGLNSFKDCSSLSAIEIPENVTTIAEGAFYNCSSINEITIPNGVTVIDKDSFRGCTNLSEITIPDTVTEIGKRAFYECKSLAEINIPSSVTKIYYYAFRYCESLTEVTIPDSVTEIGYSAFQYCYALETVHLGTGITAIDNYMFERCYSLTSINIPNTITTIGERVFYDCTSLPNLYIPNSVTGIGSNAFKNCTSLNISLPSRFRTDNNYYYDYYLQNVPYVNFY